jgi:hypothetical protein
MPHNLSPSLRDSTSLLDDPTPIRVRLYFSPSDVPALWDLASRHGGYKGDVSQLAKIAAATEQGRPVVFECTVLDQIEEMVEFFPKHGIDAPRVEEFRV